MVHLLWFGLPTQHCHAQLDSTYLPSREVGMFVQNFSTAQSLRTTPGESSQYSSSTNSGLQFFYLKTNPKQVFKRIGIAVYQSEFNQHSVFDQFDQTEETTGNNRSVSLNLYLAMGRVIQFRPHPVWGRLRIRLGAGLALATPVSARESSLSTVTDASGQVTQTTELETYRILGGVELLPRLFSHVEYRIFRQLYLGAEWGVGPTLAFEFGQKRIDHVTTQNVTFVKPSGFSLNWSGAIGGPAISLGFSF